MNITIKRSTTALLAALGVSTVLLVGCNRADDAAIPPPEPAPAATETIPETAPPAPTTTDPAMPAPTDPTAPPADPSAPSTPAPPPTDGTTPPADS